MLRFLSLVLALLWLSLLRLPLCAAEQGSVRLIDLPATAHIYVDGKPVTSRHGLLRLSPGWHAIQVETLQVSGVVACWRMVQVLARQVRTVPLHLLPVRPPEVYRGQVVILEPGVPGPPGPPGTPGSAQNAGIENPGQMLQAALDILLEDLKAQEQDAENLLSPYIPAYGYFAVENTGAYKPILGPQGSSGPPGIEGAPGLPPGILLLHDSQGKLLIEEIQSRLGLKQLEAQLAYLHAHATNPPWSKSNVVPHGIVLLTPEYRAAYEEAIRKALAAPVPPLDHPDDFALGTPMGSPGAPGPRGPDAQPPTNAPSVRLSTEQTRQLWAHFANDKNLQKQIEDLRNKVDDLKLWIGENTSQPPHN